MRQRIKRFQYIFQTVFIGIAYKCGAIALNKNDTVREVAEEASKFFCRNLPLLSRRHLDNYLRIRRIEAEIEHARRTGMPPQHTSDYDGDQRITC